LKDYFQRIRNFPFEAAIWCGGLVLLAFMNPAEPHFSICPIANLGFDWCPGCGLGKSIAYFFRGEIRQSFFTHPVGIVAVFILSFRIIQLTKTYLKTHGTRN
jgi:hypothetical protein